MAALPRPAERLARLGIVARAVVYLAIGLLSTGAALRIGGAITDTGGVFRFVLQQPLGRVLLGALALGLGAYSAWLFLQATLDPDDNGTSPIGLVNRFGQIVTGLAHLALTLEGIRLALRLPPFFGGGRPTRYQRDPEPCRPCRLVRLRRRTSGPPSTARCDSRSDGSLPAPTGCHGAMIPVARPRSRERSHRALLTPCHA